MANRKELSRLTLTGEGRAATPEALRLALDFLIDQINRNFQTIADTPSSASNGLPVGGAATEHLAKIDGTDFNTHWVAAGAPGAHAASHEPGGGDAMTVGAAATVGSLRKIGTLALEACAGNDARLNNNRDPNAHATSHKSGGSDAIKLDELAAPTDILTLNTSITAHGLAPKLSNVSTQYLSGTGVFSTPAGGSGLTHPQVMNLVSWGF